jgi:3-oxoacyl-[acyl-carrier-protein] synthase-1
MRGEAAYVIALGATTPIGRDAWSTAAAVRAGIAGFGQHPYMIDTAGESMIVARAPWLDVAVAGSRRFESLLFPALDQTLQLWTERQSGMRTALALALPAARPGMAPELQDELMAALKHRYDSVFGSVVPFPYGHAAGLLALDAAHRRLEQGVLDACVVAGVDSYFDPETLEWIEDCDQLHCAGPLNNAWGFIPGEAAAAVLLIRSGLVDQFRDMLLGQILGVGTGMEAKRIKTETVCLGEGLTTAFKGALQSLPAGQKVSDIYCDMNGEPYRADEFGFSCMRTREYFESASDFVAPADCWGDVCAAGAPLQIALATIAGKKGYANGDTAFVFASSEGGERGAAVLRVPQGVGNAG